MKKLISLLAATAIIAMSFAGCSNGTDTGAGSGTQGTGSTQGSDPTSPLKFSVTTVNFGEEPTGKVIQEAWLAKCEELMGRKLEIKFEYINSSDYSEKLKIIMAGGDLSDITTTFGMKNSEVITYGEQGVLEELSQYKEIMPNYMKAVEQDDLNKKAAYSAENKIFSFYGAQLRDHPTSYTSALAGVRGDILEKHNLEYPTTVESFYEVAKALKKEYPKIYPIIQLEEWAAVEGVLLASNHSSSDRYFNGEKFVYGPLEEGYKDALAEVKKWYDDKLIAPDFFAHKQAEGMASVSNGTGFMVPNIYTEYPGLWASEYPDQKWVLIDGLKNEKYGDPWNRQKEISAPITIQNGSGMVFSVKAKDKEGIVKFMDLQYANEVAEIITWGIEGETFTTDPTGKRVLLPEFIGGESSDKLIEIALPASGRCRAGIFPMPQNSNMLWDNFNPVCKIFNGKEIVEMQNSVYAKTVKGEVAPSEHAPQITLADAESQEYANIMTAVDTFAKEAKVQFITGERSFDEWEKYISEINAMGDIAKAMELYNSKI